MGHRHSAFPLMATDFSLFSESFMIFIDVGLYIVKSTNSSQMCQSWYYQLLSINLFTCVPNKCFNGGCSIAFPLLRFLCPNLFNECCRYHIQTDSVFYTVPTFLELGLYVPLFCLWGFCILCVLQKLNHMGKKMSRIMDQICQILRPQDGKKYLCIVSTNEHVMSGK